MIKELDTDSVHFEFVWDESKPFARHFNIVGIGNIPEEDSFFDDEFSEVKIGHIIDDVTLLDLDSAEVQLSDSDGKLSITLPDFQFMPGAGALTRNDARENFIVVVKTNVLLIISLFIS